MPQKNITVDSPQGGKTLFMASPGTAAVLVRLANGKHRRRSMRFGSPHAALTWCIVNRSNFVLSVAGISPLSLN